MKQINITELAVKRCINRGTDLMTIESMIDALIEEESFKSAYKACKGDIEELEALIDSYYSSDLAGESELKRTPDGGYLVRPGIDVQKLITNCANLKTVRETQEGYVVKLSEMMVAMNGVLKPTDYSFVALKQCSTCKGNILTEMAEYMRKTVDNDVLICKRPAELPSETQQFLDMLSKLSKNSEITLVRMPSGVEIEEINEEKVNDEDTGSSVNKKLGKLTAFARDARSEAIETDCVCRGKEIAEITSTLCRMTKANCLIVGDVGVGKRSVTMGLAKVLYSGEFIPDVLSGSETIIVEAKSLIAGSSFRGEYENRVKSLITKFGEIKKSTGKPVIVIINDINQLVYGAGEGMSDSTKEFMRASADGIIKIVGACTEDELVEGLTKRAPRFVSSCNIIKVEEPNFVDSVKMVMCKVKRLSSYHNITVEERDVAKIVQLTSLYMKDRRLPEKAIDILDECGAYINSNQLSSRRIEQKVIEQVMSKKCKMPTEKVGESSREKVLKLGENMRKSVFGQDKAIEAVCEAVAIAEAGLGDPNKPIASLLFPGATGTGKTETARRLAEALDLPLLKYDMAEFSDETSVNKLIGSSAGYIGHEEGGRLVKDVKKTGACVVLFDEIEKANHKVFDTFLGILDDGRLTDSLGMTADFTKCIIVMTSNAGAMDIGKRRTGFSTNGTDNVIGNDNIDMELKRIFKPEFLNRFSAVIKFEPITKEVAVKVAEKFIKELKNRASKRGMNLVVDEKAYEKIAECGTNIETGAREMSRYIDKNISNKVSVKMLKCGDVSGKTCTVSVLGDEFDICIE